MVPDHNYHKIVSWVRWVIAMEMSLLSNLGPGSKLSGHFVHAWVVPQSPIFRHRVDFYSVSERRGDVGLYDQGPRIGTYRQIVQYSFNV